MTSEVFELRECPPWCSIVGTTVTVHQFFCILHYIGRLRSLTIVKFGSIFCARPVVNVIERCFVTLVELSILQQFGVAYFLNIFRFEA